MHFNIKLLTTILLYLGHVECIAVFGIGKRFFGDQLILHDEIKNQHTGITEDPRIDFEYALKEPITFIEIVVK